MLKLLLLLLLLLLLMMMIMALELLRSYHPEFELSFS
jgi:hypothetical protein